MFLAALGELGSGPRICGRMRKSTFQDNGCFQKNQLRA